MELGTIDENITPDLDEYASVIDFLINKIKQRKLFGLTNITRSFRIEYYDLVKKFLQSKEQIILCHAGIAFCQISPDGDVWPCCICADSMGNLRDHNYDFKKIWNSQDGKLIRQSIKNKDCTCPLANASYTNLLDNPKSLFKIGKSLI